MEPIETLHVVQALVQSAAGCVLTASFMGIVGCRANIDLNGRLRTEPVAVSTPNRPAGPGRR